MANELKRLCGDIARWADRSDLILTDIPGVGLYRQDQPTEPKSGIYEPTLCFIVQGAKRVTLGDESYTYDPQHFLITSVDMPTISQVIKASKQKPCLGIILELDMREISQLVVDGNLPPSRVQPSKRGMALGKVTQPLISVFQRLVDLLSEPQDIAILAPIIKREIFYRLLMSEQGERLRQMAMAGSQSQQIARAIDWLKVNYKEPLRVEKLASQVHMSPSTFHHHFRTMTAMSPLQYQKWLRLHEARRLMLIEYLDASSAAYKVGYESPSQFSREYSRQFGLSPMKDIASLRQTS